MSEETARRIPPCKECGKPMKFVGRHSLGRKGGKADFFQCLNDDCSEGPQYQDAICWKIPHKNWLAAMGLVQSTPLAEENKRLREALTLLARPDSLKHGVQSWEDVKRVAREALADTVAHQKEGADGKA